MTKYISVIMAMLFIIPLVSCGKKEETVTRTEIATGIPDTVMMIEDNLTEDKHANIGDNRIQYVNSDGKDVEYIRWDSNHNVEMKKYHSYHDDGRLYQELVKFYEDGDLYLTTMSQYEFVQDSNEAIVTIWEYNHSIDKLQSDSVVCVMSTKESELYCNGTQLDPLRIRGLTETRYGMKLDYIEFIAGNQIKE